MGVSGSFTVSYSGISRQLMSEVAIKYNEQTIKVQGQWDTGATGSCLSHDVVKNLKLVPTGKKQVRTPSGSRIINTYIVDILLPNNVLITECEVMDSEIGAQGIGALIGMDIISEGDFAVSNVNGKTVFTFQCPSKHRIDFSKMARIQQVIGPAHGKNCRRKGK